MRTALTRVAAWGGLLAFAALAAAAVRSAFTTDEISYGRPGQSWLVRSHRWDICILSSRYRGTSPGVRCELGVLFVPEESGWMDWPDWKLTVPYACPLIWSAALPWFALLMPAVKRRRPTGVCRRCGYDLRATPGRCPECGRGPT